MTTVIGQDDFPIGPDVGLIADTAQRIKRELHRVIIGKDELIDTLFVCLLAERHILLEGNPGIAKTTIAKLFARTLGCTFNRQQFTPDILPSDITGSFIFDQMTGDFRVRKGGIFSNIIMIDEINRSTPRTQSALLEAMEEGSVTIEGTTFPLEKPFMVIATQTVVDAEGTYSLPEVQLDRFAVKMVLDYPTTDEELMILNTKSSFQDGVDQVTDQESILRMIETARSVYIDEAILAYIRDIVVETRINPRLLLPASPRASATLLNVARAFAAVRGRDYVIPDDVKTIAPSVLAHRLIPSADAELEGVTVREIINDTLCSVSPCP